MQNGNSAPTLAELVKLDWLILEHKKLVSGAKNTIASMSAAGADTDQEKRRLAILEACQDEFNAERETIRGYLTKSKARQVKLSKFVPTASARSSQVEKERGQSLPGRPVSVLVT